MRSGRTSRRRSTSCAPSATARSRARRAPTSAASTSTSSRRRRTRQLVAGMLDGKEVGVVFVGSVDQGLAGAVRRTVADAGGRIVLVRALRRPARSRGRRHGAPRRPGHARARRVRQPRAPRPRARARARHSGAEARVRPRSRGCSSRSSRAGDAGRSTPSWSRAPARRSRGRRRICSRASTAGSRLAACRPSGSRRATRRRRAVPVFQRRGLATVDGVDVAAGQVALVFLLAGARPGSYGIGRRRGRRDPSGPPPPGRGQGVSGPADRARRRARRGGADRRDGRRPAPPRFPDAEVVVADDGSRDGTACSGRGRRGRGSSRFPAAARGRR